jgi:hypothetical protein
VDSHAQPVQALFFCRGLLVHYVNNGGCMTLRSKCSSSPLLWNYAHGCAHTCAVHVCSHFPVMVHGSAGAELAGMSLESGTYSWVRNTNTAVGTQGVIQSLGMGLLGQSWLAWCWDLGHTYWCRSHTQLGVTNGQHCGLVSFGAVCLWFVCDLVMLRTKTNGGELPS